MRLTETEVGRATSMIPAIERVDEMAMSFVERILVNVFSIMIQYYKVFIICSTVMLLEAVLRLVRRRRYIIM